MLRTSQKPVISLTVGSAHDPSAVKLCLVTLSCNDVVKHMPVFRPRMHPCYLVFDLPRVVLINDLWPFLSICSYIGVEVSKEYQLVSYVNAVPLGVHSYKNGSSGRAVPSLSGRVLTFIGLSSKVGGGGFLAQ